MMDGRRISTDILYNNQTISVDIDPFITDVRFTDNFTGSADTISISLGDRERKWMNSWKPKKGASLEASLNISPDWGSINSSKRKLGYFEIDDISISGPSNKLTVDATSIPQSSSLKGQKKTRSWENTTFKKVAADIAKQNKLKLYFSVEENPSFDRVDQESETDLAFLMKLCNDSGFALKVANKSISIFDEVKFEKEAIVDTISRTDFRLIDYSGSDTLNNVYKSCKVTYTYTTTENNKKKVKTISATFTPSRPPESDRILVVNEKVKSKAAALNLAKKKLRAENKNGTTFSLKLAGFLTYYAGQTINLSGFGGFDGKYIITSVSGSVGNSSETNLELRKCLEGY
ncbi:phage late control D family protein [Neobacillus mesonae]|uniref:phage late control D family protein n=1 Tax=Neobacillus mesonae TaxID=1193713 RepID=UPI00203F02B8|nr:contractile injection system protein, VgrG/Pvc8 family [Neobacillus mesonae]MCM3567845.1 contractile injection system protein, VgrG/Pvc8 family [Neobacillus mesonae]